MVAAIVEGWRANLENPAPATLSEDLAWEEAFDLSFVEAVYGD